MVIFQSILITIEKICAIFKHLNGNLIVIL